MLSPTASNAPARGDTHPYAQDVPVGWCGVRRHRSGEVPNAAGRSDQGEPHLVPRQAAMVGGGQALVDKTQARVEAHEVVEAGEHQALAAVDARCLNDGAQ